MQWLNIAGLEFGQEIVGNSDHGYITWFFLKGPYGGVKAWDIGYITDGYYEQYPDRLWDMYKTLLSVRDGHYHCCLVGKVWNF